MSDALPAADLSAYLARPTEAELEARRLFSADESLVIFDIGACEGEDSLRYALRFPRARVFAFEPLPANQALARTLFFQHPGAALALVPLALTDTVGQAVFHVSSGQPSELFAGENWNYGNKSSSLLAPAGDQPMHGWIQFKETITVTTDTLDAYCARTFLDHIDFIHMDVQGAELRVLAGGERMLPRITAIWLEVATREFYRGQPLAADVQRFMRARGFVLGFCVYRANGEGDHLYLNLSHPRTWRYLAARTARAIARKARGLCRRLLPWRLVRS